MMRIREGASGRVGCKFAVLLIGCVALSFSTATGQVAALATFARFRLPRQAESKADADRKALDKVLAQMDTAATNFRAVQANFEWLQYTKVVDDKDYQKGTIFYRRQGKGIEMMADIAEPSKKAVLYRDGKVQVAQPNLGVTPYDAGKNREAVESFLVLGFGGSGHDLERQFDVKYGGSETFDGVQTAKLELVPKSPKVRGIFDKIWLWIDPALGISRQQQFFEPQSGNYRLAKYTNILLKQKLDDSIFKLPAYAEKKSSDPKN
jgi:outer membrane lipoprotein-sorting protein